MCNTKIVSLQGIIYLSNCMHDFISWNCLCYHLTTLWIVDKNSVDLNEHIYILSEWLSFHAFFKHVKEGGIYAPLHKWVGNPHLPCPLEHVYVLAYCLFNNY